MLRSRLSGLDIGYQTRFDIIGETLMVDWLVGLLQGITFLQSPIIKYQLLVTSYHNYQLPVTSYQLPITNDQSSNLTATTIPIFYH
ncbi:MAG: hypothetical protein F6K26_02140 [Moorea sp. SIO2I5]|nr:hypothetical protein [Moorena sp. SIO2I5]